MLFNINYHEEVKLLGAELNPDSIIADPLTFQCIFFIVELLFFKSVIIFLSDMGAFIT